MHATFAFDSHRVPVFQGSCGVVAHYLRKSLRALGYKVTELYVPLTDKTSALDLPSVPRPSPDDVRIFFEELFVRASDSPDFSSAKNVSFFNLLASDRMELQSRADLAIMNSAFMARALEVELAQRGAPLPKRLGWAPLPLPLFDFPNGYPSPGGSIDRSEFRALARDHHIGHALRPFKMNCFATLSILHHLNVAAERAGTKPYCLVVPEVDFARCERALTEMPIPTEVLEGLVPVRHVNNRSMVWMMRHSDFGLCYDDFVEPFGYYPVESIYLGCPIFTNGSGNLRHVLPKGHGVNVRETMQMHFGSPEERVTAYEPVAQAIRVAVTKPAAEPCARGRAYLLEHHRPVDLTSSLERHLRTLREAAPRRRTQRRVKVSPYLRLADWSRGRFVTDHGTIEDAPLAAHWKALLTPGNQRDARPLAGTLDHRVLFES